MRKTLLTLSILCLFPTIASAQATFSAKLCWSPLTNPDVQGYNLHVSDSGNPFVASTIDLGLPVPNVAGNMVHNIDIAPGAVPTLTFRVSAYGTTGTKFWEGPQSNPLDINCTTVETVTGKQVCPPSCLRGDITCDGVVTINDVLALLRVIANLGPVPTCGP